MNKVVYYIFYIWMFLHALLPLGVLYILSDVLYLLVYKTIGYRLKVVRLNLKNAFPEKSEEERRKIEKDFYHHFCDYFVETIKLFHISDKEMQKRMRFENMEQVERISQAGNSILMFLGHYGNWEWVPSINLCKENGKMRLGQIYRPLKNKAFDDLFLKLRSRFGSFGIAKNNTLREIIRLKKENIQTMIGFMSDQTPSLNNIHYWTNFMNQDTPVYTGVERIAKKTGFAVAYLDVQKVKRGYYTASVRLISDNPQAEPENAITERYIREMEKTIMRNPAYWLWTHKRWKWTREKVAAKLAEQHKK
ncbi:lysophospholipid acyltransferase family protein [Dysgonomonas sp. 25]|uniref:lysophospholipid acyltransferase family protein n=1 Tax=Dysgonomonas sp. 25 TaxID=2302933 RepID=UPI0013D18294|nr:lysophospholipid acyltransferase family protein [Dysgonomonas sp. 25]NDV69615.1 acetyltransferase [Dysgonomonas sp. 25]